LTLALLVAAFVAVAAAPAQAKDPDDQIVITGTVDVPAGKTVGDVVVVDGPVTVAGTVHGDVVSITGRVTISGTVRGDVTAFDKRVVLTPTARISGDLLYGDKRPVVPAGAVVSGDVKKEDFTKAATPARFAAYIGLWIAFTVSSLLLGLLFLWLAPRAADAALRTARTSVGPAIAWGLGLFFGLPVAAVVLLVTLVGIPLGLGVLLALLPLGALCYVVSAYVLGRVLVKPPTGRLPAFLAGWGILRGAALIPFLGALAWFAATVFGLGVLVVALWRARGEDGAASAPVGAAPGGSG
jgi:cytoskeletal protein CcmA (bactofilin family)